MIKTSKENIDYLLRKNLDDDYLDGFALKLFRHYPSKKYGIRFELQLINEMNPVRTQISEELFDNWLEEKCKSSDVHWTHFLQKELKQLLVDAAKVDELAKAIICNIDKTQVLIFKEDGKK